LEHTSLIGQKMSTNLQALIDQVLQYKRLYENGLMSKEEFDARRLALIDSVLHTEHKTQHQNPVNLAYADRHFPVTNPNAMRTTDIIVVHSPTPHNSNLHVPGATTTSSPSSTSEAVLINPQRGRQLPKNVTNQDGSMLLYVENRAGVCDADEQVARLDEERQKLQWQLFKAAATNDVPQIMQLLKAGANVDQRDHDTEATPLLLAASKGNKHAVYYLVSRGASINVQNFRGETALHEAVKLKDIEMALWLTIHGADIDLENFRGYSSYDIALPWLQKDLRDARDEFIRKQNQQISAMRVKVQQLDQISEIIQISATNASKPRQGAYEERYGVPVNKTIVRDEMGNIIHSSDSVVQPRGLEIYLKGKSDKTVTVPVSPSTTAKDLCELVAAKLNITKHSNHLEVIQSICGKEMRVLPSAVISSIMSNWPPHLGPSDTAQHKFIVAPVRGAPEPLTMAYRAVVYC